VPVPPVVVPPPVDGSVVVPVPPVAVPPPVDGPVPVPTLAVPPPVVAPPVVASEVPVEPAGLDASLAAGAAAEPRVPEPVVAEPVVAVPAAEVPDADAPAGEEPLFGSREACTGPMNTRSMPSWRGGVQSALLLRACSHESPSEGAADATPCGRKTAPLTSTATISGLQASCPNMSGGPPDDRW
jgi:hypothetical protein